MSGRLTGVYQLPGGGFPPRDSKLWVRVPTDREEGGKTVYAAPIMVPINPPTHPSAPGFYDSGLLGEGPYQIQKAIFGAKDYRSRWYDVVLTSGSHTVQELIEDYDPDLYTPPVVNQVAVLRDETISARDEAAQILEDVSAGAVPDTAVAAKITASDTQTRAAVDARVTAVGNEAFAPVEVAAAAVNAAAIAVVATPQRFSGIDPTGATDSTGGIQAAVAATPQGGTLVIPSGSYLLNSAVAVQNRSITLVVEGSITSVTSPFIFSATAETIYAVSTMTSSTITNPLTTQFGTQLVLSSGTPDWKRGDVVKVISDDIVPGARLGDGTSEARLGQYMTVESVSGSTINLVGVIREPMTTNVRVTRMPRYAIGLRGNGAFPQIGGPIIFRHLLAPQVDARTAKSGGQGFLFQGCYAYSFWGQVSDCPDDGSTFGYGIMDNAGAYATIQITAARCRHAYTDDTPRIPVGSTEVWRYGRSFGHKVRGTAVATTNTGFDTHAAAEAIDFDVTAVDCTGGLGLRGRNHTGKAKIVRPAKSAWKFFSEENRGTESWGHDIEADVYDPAPGVPVGAAVINTGTGFANAGVREVRPSRVRCRIHADGAPAVALDATNATLIHEMTVMTKSGAIAPGINLTNSVLRSSAPLTLIPTVVASDGFSGSNGNIATGRNTDNEFGGSTLSWTASPSSRLGIQSGMLVSGSVDGLGGIYLPLSTANIRATLRVRDINSDSEILHVDIRRQTASHVIDGTDNAWTVIIGAGKAQLAKKVAGVLTKFGDAYSYPAETDVAVQAYGSLITLLVGGEEKISVTDTDVASGSYVGIYKTKAGNMRNPNWVKFESLATA
ncbi:minor tail protein [Gordonia phage Phabuloso]|nr:minor tail protein [Gordonia phage Phabuloso]